MTNMVQVGSTYVTDLQFRILEYISSGVPVPSNPEIAAALFVGERSVKTALQRLYRIALPLEVRGEKASLIGWFRRAQQGPEVAGRDHVIRRGSVLACNLRRDLFVADGPRASPVGLIESPFNKPLRLGSMLQIETPTFAVIECERRILDEVLTVIFPGPDAHATWHLDFHEDAVWWFVRGRASMRFMEDIGNIEMACTVVGVSLEGELRLNCSAYDAFLNAIHRYFMEVIELFAEEINGDADTFEGMTRDEQVRTISRVLDDGLQFPGPRETTKRQHEDCLAIVDGILEQRTRRRDRRVSPELTNPIINGPAV